MHIPAREAQPGDTVAWRGSGPLFKFLSFLLGLPIVGVKEWRVRKWKPWHFGVVTLVEKRGIMTIEALEEGVVENLYSWKEIERHCRIYRRLPEPPNPEDIDRFRKMYLGRPYDKSAYFGVIIVYLVNKTFKIKLGRWVDTELMCWEVDAAWYRFTGYPLQPNFEYPMIHVMLRKLEEGQ